MKSESGQAQPVRRHHERAFKAKLIELSLQPGASVSAIAMQHGINANMLFTWRRTWLRQGKVESEAVLLPVRIERQAPSVPAPSAPVATSATSGGVIELEIAGAKLRLRGNVNEGSLRSVLRALRETT